MKSFFLWNPTSALRATYNRKAINENELDRKSKRIYHSVVSREAKQIQAMQFNVTVASKHFDCECDSNGNSNEHHTICNGTYVNAINRNIV